MGGLLVAVAGAVVGVAVGIMTAPASDIAPHEDFFGGSEILFRVAVAGAIGAVAGAIGGAILGVLGGSWAGRKVVPPHGTELGGPAGAVSGPAGQGAAPDPGP